MINEKLKTANTTDAAVGKSNGTVEGVDVQGTYTAVCRDKDGNIKWADDAPNLVTTLGKNLILDTIITNTAYTFTGPFLGLVNGSASSAAAGDTLLSRTGGWVEVGGTNAPAYTGNRSTPTWSAASNGSKANSGTITFSFTSGGTVGGCFLVLGTGAVNTKDNTSGLLYSVGAFSGGSKTVAASDTLTVTYTAQA